MKVGRNDPCPCGSGKKYKKCCLVKDQEASSSQTNVIPPPRSAVAPLPPDSSKAPTPALPPDPITERAESLWREFESQNGEGRIAVFSKVLEDAEVMTDDLAFEMLRIIYEDAVKSGDR